MKNTIVTLTLVLYSILGFSQYVFTQNVEKHISKKSQKKIEKFEKRYDKYNKNNRRDMRVYLSNLNRLAKKNNEDVYILEFVGERFIKLFEKKAVYDDSWLEYYNKEYTYNEYLDTGLHYFKLALEIRPRKSNLNILIKYDDILPENTKKKLYNLAYKKFPKYPLYVRRIIKYNYEQFKTKEAKNILNEIKENFGDCSVLYGEAYRLFQLRNLNGHPFIQNHLKRIEEQRELLKKLAKLPKCADYHRTERKIHGALLSLHDAKKSDILFQYINKNSQLRAFPSYYCFKIKNGWRYFYLIDELTASYQDIDNKAINNQPFHLIQNSIFYGKTVKLAIYKDGFEIAGERLYIGNTGNLIHKIKDDVIQVDLTFEHKEECIVGNCQNGFGVYYDPNFRFGDKSYRTLSQGSWVNGNLNGVGRIEFLDIEDEIRRKSDCGYVVQQINKGSHYEGEFKNGLFHGYGKYLFYRSGFASLTATYKNERVGEFRNGKFIGEAEMTGWASVQSTISKAWTTFEETYGEVGGAIDCYGLEVHSTGNLKNKNDENLPLMEVNCDGIRKLQYFYWDGDLFNDSGYYKDEGVLGVDSFLGKNKDVALRELCNCKN